MEKNGKKGFSTEFQVTLTAVLLLSGMIILGGLPETLDFSHKAAPMPREIKNEAYYIKAIHERGWCGAYYGGLENVPPEFRTPRVCLEGIKHGFGCIRNISDVCPNIDRTGAMALAEHGGSLWDLPATVLDTEIIKTYLKHYGNLYGIPTDYRTDEMYVYAVAVNPNSYKDIPNELKDTTMTRTVLMQEPNLLKHVPRHLITRALAIEVLKQDGLQLEVVPLELYSPALYRTAVENNGKALQFVPFEQRTLALCRLALLRSNEAFDFVPRRFFLPDDNGGVSQLSRLLESHADKRR